MSDVQEQNHKATQRHSLDVFCNLISAASQAVTNALPKEVTECTIWSIEMLPFTRWKACYPSVRKALFIPSFSLRQDPETCNKLQYKPIKTTEKFKTLPSSAALHVFKFSSPFDSLHNAVLMIWLGKGEPHIYHPESRTWAVRTCSGSMHLVAKSYNIPKWFLEMFRNLISAAHFWLPSMSPETRAAPLWRPGSLQH